MTFHDPWTPSNRDYFVRALYSQVDAGLRFENNKQRYQHMFSIKTPKRDYYLAAETEEEMNKWVDCVCHVCGLKPFITEDTVTGTLTLVFVFLFTPLFVSNLPAFLHVSSKIIIINIIIRIFRYYYYSFSTPPPSISMYVNDVDVSRIFYTHFVILDES